MVTFWKIGYSALYLVHANSWASTLVPGSWRKNWLHGKAKTSNPETNQQKHIGLHVCAYSHIHVQSIARNKTSLRLSLEHGFVKEFTKEREMIANIKKYTSSPSYICLAFSFLSTNPWSKHSQRIFFFFSTPPKLKNTQWTYTWVCPFWLWIEIKGFTENQKTEFKSALHVDISFFNLKVTQIQKNCLGYYIL